MIDDIEVEPQRQGPSKKIILTESLKKTSSFEILLRARIWLSFFFLKISVDFHVLQDRTPTIQWTVFFDIANVETTNIFLENSDSLQRFH